MSAASRTPLLVLSGLLLVGLPLVVSFEGLDKFRVPKDVFCGVCTLGLLGLAAVADHLRSLFRRGIWSYLLVTAWIYAVVHTLVLERWAAGLPAVLWLGCFVALLLVLKEYVDEHFQQRLWLAIGAASAVNAIMTVAQYVGAFSWMLRPTGEVLEGRYIPSGLIGDVNSGGFLFGLVCLMTIHTLTVEPNKGLRFLGVVIFVLNLTGLAFSLTLTAVLALVITLGLWLVFHHWWLFKTRRRVWRSLLISVLVIALGSGLSAALVVRSGLIVRIQGTLYNMRQGDWTVATSGRQPVFAITWQMIQEKPWLGRGLNTFGEDFFHFRANTEYGRSVEMINQPGAYREVHNEYLQIWEELGAVGLLLCVLLLLGAFLGGAVRILREREPTRLYWTGILALGLVFVSLNAMGFFPLHLSVSAAYVVFLVAGLRRVSERPYEAADAWIAEGAPARTWGWRSWKTWLIWGAVLAAAFPLVQRWRANVELGVAQYVLERAGSSGLSRWQTRVYCETALQRLKAAEYMAPGLAENYNLQGSAAMLTEDYREAARQYEKAARRAPSPEVLTNLAAARMALGELAAARGLLETALRYNPDYGNAQRALNYLKTRQQ